MQDAEKQLTDIKEASDKMTPEDRVSFTMELQEDVAAKVKVITELVEKETGLLPQGKSEQPLCKLNQHFFSSTSITLL